MKTRPGDKLNGQSPDGGSEPKEGRTSEPRLGISPLPARLIRELASGKLQPPGVPMATGRENQLSIWASRRWGRGQEGFLA